MNNHGIMQRRYLGVLLHMSVKKLQSVLYYCFCSRYSSLIPGTIVPCGSFFGWQL